MRCCCCVRAATCARRLLALNDACTRVRLYAVLSCPRAAPEARKRGVIAASAGNHALALAYHGQELGIPVTVVMPRIAPITKIQNCRELNANVMIQGAHIGEAKEYAMGLAERESLTYINGFDHPHVIAGAGTLGMEIIEQVRAVTAARAPPAASLCVLHSLHVPHCANIHTPVRARVVQVPDVEAVVIPVGGAGLIAGTALAIKALRPDVKIIGVEPATVPSLTAALDAGKPVTINGGPTLADGLLVPRVGTNAFALCQQHVDKVVLVKEKFIALAMLRLAEMEKAVVEGGGATGLAGLLQGVLPELEGKRVVIP
ncbi:pyridoxal-phosphate dependent enzyme, partial [archaeon]